MDASNIYFGMLANIVQTKRSLHFITHRDQGNYPAVECRRVMPQSTGVLCLSLTLWGHNDFSIYLVPEGLLHNVLNKAVPLDAASFFSEQHCSLFMTCLLDPHTSLEDEIISLFQQNLPVLEQPAFSSLEHKQTFGNCCLNSGAGRV